jgi:hypothetical protein
MPYRSTASLVLLLALSACTKPASSGDVLAANLSESVAFQHECVGPKNADGTCNKATCKKDAESDCELFSSSCLKRGHHYEGTNDAGTCTRVL